VSPGDYIAMKYLENRHVTLPETIVRKPQGAGNVYIFGTSTPDANERLTEVMEWTQDGTGGEGKMVSWLYRYRRRCEMAYIENGYN
jgi:hypothetical protein